MITEVRLSRAIAHALRHAPWAYELELDEDGWAPVEQLLDALRRKGGDWSGVDRHALDRMVATASQRRYEIGDGRIRALYGHSLPGAMRKTAADPPALLFHGTAPRTWRSIQTDGLRPMQRQHVHLSRDVATAMAVGRRKCARPVVLIVRAAEAARSGITFYEGNDLVWLTDSIPPDFLEVADRAQ